jgi:hypothetical protein
MKSPMKKAMTSAAAMAFVRSKSDRTKDGCRVWSGFTDSRGHPKTNIDGNSLSVRKLVYEAINGPVPVKHRLFASCLCHGCIEPTHMEPVHTSAMFVWMREHGILNTVANQTAALRSAAKRRVPDAQRDAIRAMAETLPMTGPRGTKMQSIRTIASAFCYSEKFVQKLLSTPSGRNMVPCASIFSIGAELGRQQRAGVAR